MRTLFFIVFLGLANQLFASANPDSLLLKIDKRNQTVVGGSQDKGKTLREELDQIFQKKGLVLTDSLWQQIRTVIRTDSEGDSSLSVQIGGSKVKIGVIKSGAKYDTREKTFKMNYPNDDRKISIKKDSSGKSLVIHSDGKEEVRVGWNGIHVKDGKEEVHVDWNGVQVKEANGEETKVIWGSDSTKTKKKDKGANLYTSKGFNLYLGLNGLTGKMPEVTTMIYPAPYLSTDSELKPLGSRFVSLDFSNSGTIASGKKSALKFMYGISFDWYNFMFDHNRVVTKSGGATIFQPLQDAQGNEIELRKNKLTASYITLPIMPYVAFSKQSAIQMIGLGGYVSYRLDSWTKTIEEKSENLRREGSNFNINQVRYGVKAEIGLRRIGELFFNYDLTPLFEKGYGPQLTAFSFGIKL
ncbi:outer membrane beta-barrel protein [Aquirufa sp. 5-AUSEE-100C1]